ncbi:SCO2523 family variant P-loop protein [Nocardia sp. NPDC051990]|uniref:SCO2523 family variant P-loop protein n=1 Tax=Nocardia sp. NPDC051990 TaxID=3155285 RepID=UPI00342E168B
MIVFATSDKGGTGRSVTSCNLAYRMCVRGKRVAYLDFDFGSPTAGALFEISGAERGISGGDGLHSYLLGKAGVPARIDVRDNTDRRELRKMRTRTGKLFLLPGDAGGAEFAKIDDRALDNCAKLLLELDQDFDVCIVDLSAGRSVAMEIALKATALPQLAGRTVRWLVFHRWTRQHIIAAHGLVRGGYGLLDCGEGAGHDREVLLDNIRYVRTAVPQLNEATESPGPQAAWLHQQDSMLKRLASTNKVGASAMLGETPVEPVLQWREQLILDIDVQKEIANKATVEAFDTLADRVLDPATWRRI